jgi:hypothetical protein
MKSLMSLIILFLLSSGMSDAQQTSDYAIVLRYKEMTQAVSKSIELANTVQDCVEANASLDVLEKDYQPYRELLNKSIYPDGYDKTIEQLRGKLILRQRDLGVIESQMTRIAELEVQVRDLSDQVSKLNIQNDKLLGDIKQLSQNIQKLSGDLFSTATPIDSLRKMIVLLRQGLQERDQLIFALTDSLFLQYDKDVSKMKDIEKQGLMGKMERHGIINNVRRSIMNNLTFLESTQLKGSDLVSLVRQHQRFQSQWIGLAPKISTLYLSGKARRSEVIGVDSMLAVWGDKVDEALWRSLNTLCKEKGFVVKEFKNGEEFYTNLLLFLEEQIQNTAKETNDTRFKLFTNFNENLWQADLRPTWLPGLVELRKISELQSKEIDAKVEQWHSSVSPGVSWMTYVLIALCIIVIVVVSIRLFQKPKKVIAQE